jgi:hypothetical protein
MEFGQKWRKLSAFFKRYISENFDKNHVQRGIFWGVRTWNGYHFHPLSQLQKRLILKTVFSHGYRLWHQVTPRDRQQPYTHSYDSFTHVKFRHHLIIIICKYYIHCIIGLWSTCIALYALYKITSNYIFGKNKKVLSIIPLSYSKSTFFSGMDYMFSVFLSPVRGMFLFILMSVYIGIWQTTIFACRMFFTIIYSKSAKWPFQQAYLIKILQICIQMFGSSSV